MRQGLVDGTDLLAIVHDCNHPISVPFDIEYRTRLNVIDRSKGLFQVLKMLKRAFANEFSPRVKSGAGVGVLLSEGFEFVPPRKDHLITIAGCDSWFKGFLPG